MNNLNKQNFFNEMGDRYPFAHHLFLLWIDEFKNKIGWKSIFNEQTKFHDLPFELQFGILCRLLGGKTHKENGEFKFDINEMRGELTTFYVKTNAAIEAGKLDTQ